jgi:phosphate transport system substrate-binding protein
MTPGLPIDSVAGGISRPRGKASEEPLTVAARGRRGIRSTTVVLRTCAVAAALLSSVAACGHQVTGGTGSAGSQVAAHQAAVSEPAGTISETGSGLLYPLATTWAAAYHRANPGVTITTARTGSGHGISAASGGIADIGASDAYLSSGDLVKNNSLLNIPLAVSAQTVIYNLPGLSQARHVNLNGAVLAKIFEGTITMWNDPAIVALNRNPPVTLPPLRIVPLHRSDSSGDTFLFTSYLSTRDSHWNDAIGYGTLVNWPHVPGGLAEGGSVPTMNGCEATPGCIAYNGISYMSQETARGLGEAELANAAGNFELPTTQAITAAISTFVSLTPPNETISLIDGPAAAAYPIVNYEYAIVSTRQPNARKASEIKNFLTWVITAGNQASYLSPVGFQPLPDELVVLGTAQIQEIGS